MKAAKPRFLLVFAVLAGVTFGLPSAGQAKRYHIVRDSSGKARLVDPEDTFMNRVTHPWKLFRKPVNAVKKSVTPRKKKQPMNDFGKPIGQRQMESSPSVVERISGGVSDAASTVNSVPVVRKCTRTVSGFWKALSNPFGSPGPRRPARR